MRVDDLERNIKVLRPVFLDVDGVLNSYRNVVAQGGFPFPKGSPASEDPKHREENLDPLAVGMVRELCKRRDAQIVLHSTWRMHTDPIEFGKRWGLPVVDSTDHGDKPGSIKRWLVRHPEVVAYVILDDDNMQDKEHQVFTDLYEGLLYTNFRTALEKLI